MRWEFIGWLTSFKRRTKANSNKSELLFALTDKKNKNTQNPAIGNDGRVCWRHSGPVCRKMRNERGQRPVIWCQTRRGKISSGLFRTCCVAPGVWRRKKLEDVLTVSSSGAADSLMHSQKNEHLSLLPPRNSCEPGNQIWSGSSDLVLFFFLPLNVHAHIFLVRIQSPEKLWIMSHNTLCFVIYTHVFLKQASNSVLSLCRT